MAQLDAQIFNGSSRLIYSDTAVYYNPTTIKLLLPLNVTADGTVQNLTIEIFFQEDDLLPVKSKVDGHIFMIALSKKILSSSGGGTAKPLEFSIGNKKFQFLLTCVPIGSGAVATMTFSIFEAA